MHGSIGGRGPYPSLLEKTHLFNSHIKITKNKNPPPPILTLYKNFLDLRDKKVAAGLKKGCIFDDLGITVRVRKRRVAMILYGKKIASLLEVVFLKIHLQVVYTIVRLFSVISYFKLHDAAVEIYRLGAAFSRRI